MKYRLLFTMFFCCCLSFTYGIETQIIVRAKAKDAKFIGSSIGGAHVTIRNSMTDEILAQGITEGSTGNTELIMSTPRQRHSPIALEGTAHFLATIDIAQPLFVTIEVTGPMGDKQSAVHASTQLWLIPGKHILGDGVILELPGFVIDIISPRTHQIISIKDLSENKIEIQANIVMMCGCPIEIDGLWDAENIEVAALIKKDGISQKPVPLTCVFTNLFRGEIDIDTPGKYEVVVYAYDPKTGNTGVDQVNYVVR